MSTKIHKVLVKSISRFINPSRSFLLSIRGAAKLREGLTCHFCPLIKTQKFLRIQFWRIYFRSLFANLGGNFFDSSYNAGKTFGLKIGKNLVTEFLQYGTVYRILKWMIKIQKQRWYILCVQNIIYHPKIDLLYRFSNELL